MFPCRCRFCAPRSTFNARRNRRRRLRSRYRRNIRPPRRKIRRHFDRTEPDPRIAEARRIYEESGCNRNETLRQLRAKELGASEKKIKEWVKDIECEDPRIALVRKIYEESCNLNKAVKHLKAKGLGVAWETAREWVKDIKCEDRYDSNVYAQKRAAARKLYLKGITNFAEIAREVDVSPNSIKSWLLDLLPKKEKIHKPKWSYEQKRAEARKIYKESGCNLSKTEQQLRAKGMGASHKIIKRWIKGVECEDQRILARRIYKETGCNMRETIRQLQARGLDPSDKTIKKWVKNVDCDQTDYLSGYAKKRADARRLYLGGMKSPTAIARQVGASPTSVSSWLSDLRPIKTRPLQDYEQILEEAKDLFQNCDPRILTEQALRGGSNISNKHIGILVGASTSAVRNWRKAGLLGPEPNCENVGQESTQCLVRRGRSSYRRNIRPPRRKISMTKRKCTEEQCVHPKYREAVNSWLQTESSLSILARKFQVAYKGLYSHIHNKHKVQHNYDKEIIEHLKKIESGCTTKKQLMNKLSKGKYATETILNRLIKNGSVKKVGRSRALKYCLSESAKNYQETLKVLPEESFEEELVWEGDIPWEEAIDSLRSKNYSLRELGRMLSKKIPYAPETIKAWLSKTQIPGNRQAKIALVLLDRGLQPFSSEQQKRSKAIKLYKNGLNPTQIQQKLKVGHYKLKNWLSSELEEEEHFDWKIAIDKLLDKGYTQRALAEILCEKHSCKISTALHWFGRITANPPRWAQKAIVLLNNELPSIDWKKAIDNLLNSGYTKTELSRILSRETGCKFRTAIHWFAKRQLPPLKMRIAIVELEKNLLS